MLPSRTNPWWFKRFILCFVLIKTLLIPSSILAHRVTLFAWVDGDTVHTQSRFAGGRAVKNGQITVYDAQGKVLLRGQTDSNGEFNFKRPDHAGARIVLDTGTGHGNEWVLKKAPDSSLQEATRTVTDDDGHAIGLRPDEIKAIVDESIDKKLKPLMESVAKLHDSQPSVTDILGGLGYIIGLVGVAAYVHSRKKG